MEYGDKGPEVRALQQQLQAAGIDAGGLDGVFGPGMARGLAAFAQRTLKGDACSSWLAIGMAEIGQREVVGVNHNPRIIEYHTATSLKSTDDETAWCSSFVSWCLEQAKVPSTRSARARSYMEWGETLVGPVPGCVVVFWRGSTAKDGAGHVGFYVGGDPKKGKIAVLGGNQGNMVKVAATGVDKLLGYRWPQGVAKPTPPEIAAALAQDVNDAVETSWG